MNIYVSPHNDDVCFSIGGLAARQGGILVNIFTLSTYLARATRVPDDPQARIAFITRLRRCEDESFAAAVGLRRHDLGLCEPRLLGRQPFDAGPAPAEAKLLGPRLVLFLLSLLPENSIPDTAALYCPMGIGGHANHLSTLLAIRQGYQSLASRCAVYLYEDLHYASKTTARDAGLQRAGHHYAGLTLTRHVLPLTQAQAERKMQHVRLYASQHAAEPSMDQFTPASGAYSGPHEIIWRVSSTQDP